MLQCRGPDVIQEPSRDRERSVGEKRECVKMIVTEVEAEIEAAIEIGTGSVMEIQAAALQGENQRRRKEKKKWTKTKRGDTEDKA